MVPIALFLDEQKPHSSADSPKLAYLESQVSHHVFHENKCNSATGERMKQESNSVGLTQPNTLHPTKDRYIHRTKVFSLLKTPEMGP